jgi:hypothetical protein
MIRNIAAIFVLAASALALPLLVSCAGMSMPPGGPPDTTPPAVIRTEPDTMAVNVVTSEVVLEFSEYVDRRSVEEAVFISPYTGGVEFEWSGTSVAILPNEPLQDNRTYVITVGTDVVDRNGKNRMASGFTLAFSTGDSIDRGSISGRVVDEKPDGVLVFAYLLDARDPDTLNPGQVRPDYVMQTGKDGMFTLSNVALARYRLFAVRDQYRDFLYQTETDEFGVLGADLRLTPDAPVAGPVFFRLSREDTTRPFLTGATTSAPRTVTVRFSEPVDSLSLPTARFQLTDTIRNSVVEGIAFAPDRSTSSGGVLITSAPLDSGTTYRLTAQGIVDRAGNPVDSTWVECVATGGGDSVAPGFMLAGSSDSLRGHPADRPLVLRFSEPVQRVRAAAGIALQDTHGTAVPFGVSWALDAECFLRPLRPLNERTRYTLRIQGDALEDYYGNRRGDSVLSLTVFTVDPRTTGVVEGRVTDPRDTARGEVRVIARPLAARTDGETVLTLPGPGPFRFDRLPEGKYQVWAYRDADSSGAFTPGHPFPWAPAERFAAYADTVKIRARWNVEGVNLNLR